MEDMHATRSVQRSWARGYLISGRWTFLAASTLTLLLLGLLPPLVSVNRYQRRISTSISTSLGRPVHFDQVLLNLLPLPSLTITNFVIEEDPAFGAEPIIRANTVQATLRVSSLWRGRIEFSRISFTDPSINLVHDRNGQWNFESILLQASQIETAPTAQSSAGSKPRFPYIEATGARMNLKEGIEKTPFSLSEADFALWLPNPQEWRMRVRGRPVRTDTSASDTGSFQIEATLGRAASLESVPLAVEAAWRGAPLGEASRLLLARDLGLRGEMTLTASVQGSLSRNSLQTHLQINGLRRSDFVPEKTMSLDLNCAGTATRVFHTMAEIRCSWPVPDADSATLALSGILPNILRLGSAEIEIGTSKMPVAFLLDWLRVASFRMPPTLSATGLLTGSISRGGDSGTGWKGQASIPELRLSGATFGTIPLVIEDLSLHSVEQPADNRHSHPPKQSSGAVFALSPLALSLGGKDPAVLDGFVDSTGYTVHLRGMILPNRLWGLGAAVPQFGDGLANVIESNRPSGPVHVDLTAHRDWGGEQIWTDNQAHAGIPPSHPAKPRTHRRFRATSAQRRREGACSR